MIKMQYKDLNVGDKYCTAVFGWKESPTRVKTKEGGEWVDGTTWKPITYPSQIVYIKEKKMTDKEKAIKRIEAAEQEIKEAKAILNKPERIKVPDCIDIKKGLSSWCILFNDRQQALYNDGIAYAVSANYCGWTKNEDLYLEPCKKEDLKPGDVAYMSNYCSRNICATESNYFCVLGDGKYAYISDGEDVIVCSCAYTYCWKVVQ